MPAAAAWAPGPFWAVIDTAAHVQGPGSETQGLGTKDPGAKCPWTSGPWTLGPVDHGPTALGSGEQGPWAQETKGTGRDTLVHIGHLGRAGPSGSCRI